ncbi:PhaM family polyhydroxyalkanoate granule multifunctional regulatory protein [Delftia acidovorans]|uniref:PhaM family polyhydroxyalkanoate granule multifunctional regulatory protein n=1 Tax=Delftia acidovorans TaxID=80866 RepID=UPI003017B9D3
MSDVSSFGFGKFIPGFDFLQGLAQSAGSATARPLGRLPEWVAPTVSIEEVDKRITELKAVQFWLDQNGKALAATIQALEVQRMTLSTLQGMNVSMGELAQAFQFPAAAAATAAATAGKGAASAGQSDHSDWPMSSAGKAGKQEKPQAAPAQPAAEPPAAAAAAASDDAGGKASGPEASAPKDEPAQAAAMGQAMQWWGALTQQFQQIAAKAMAEPMAPEAVAAAQRATGMAGDIAKAAMERMTAQAGAFAAQAGKAAASAAKAPATKTAAKAAAPAASAAEAPKANAPAKAATRKTAAKTTAKAPARTAATGKAPAKSRPPR